MESSKTIGIPREFGIHRVPEKNKPL